MSYSLNSSTSSGATSNEAGRYVVPPRDIQSAISSHQHKSAPIATVSRGDELIGIQNELQAVGAAYFSGKMTGSEFDAALGRVMGACQDRRRRITDFDARSQAGQTQPADWFKEFNGYTDEEAQEHLRQGSRLMDVQIANGERSQSHILQKSRSGRSH